MPQWFANNLSPPLTFYVSLVNSVLKYIKPLAQVNKWAYGKVSDSVPEHSLIAHMLFLIILTNYPEAQQSVFFCHMPLTLSKPRLCLVELTSGLLHQPLLFGVTQKITLVECQLLMSKVILLCTILSSAPRVVPGIKEVVSIY